TSATCFQIRSFGSPTTSSGPSGVTFRAHTLPDWSEACESMLRALTQPDWLIGAHRQTKPTIQNRNRIIQTCARMPEVIGRAQVVANSGFVVNLTMCRRKHGGLGAFRTWHRGTDQEERRRNGRFRYHNQRERGPPRAASASIFFVTCGSSTRGGA